MNFRRAFFTVGGFTLLSRVVGFCRDVLAANYMGAGMAADAFFVALRLPNLFRRLFAEGAFTISFVPLFTTHLKNSQAEAHEFAEQALAILMAVLVPFTLLAMLGMPWIMQVITPGYAADAEKFALAVDLSRITFPYLLFISLAALLGSILNAVGRFGPYAAAPIAFNLVQIAALAVWNETEIETSCAQAWAVMISGIVQLLWLMVSAWRAGWLLRLRRPRLTDGMKRLLRLIGPGALSAGVTQVNIFIDMILASLLPAGAISYLAYADRLYQLPVGVIGIAIGTALLPSLSRTLREQGGGHALSEQNRAIEFGLYLGVPSAVGIALLAHPIIATVYERGAFLPAASVATAWAVSAFALAIPAYMVSKVLLVAFYAREDTATPFRISLQTVLANTLTSAALIYILMHTGHENIAHAGLALSTAFTAWLNVALLRHHLRRHGHFAGDSEMKQRLQRLAVCALIMALWLALGHWLTADIFAHGPLLQRIIALAVLVGSAAGLYFVLAHKLGVQRLDELVTLLRRPRLKMGGDLPTDS